ncbi:aminotransferase class V-fold PLP-dependent enzyme [Robertkochia solimangrovi]|uniref:aminotransferase class V-fold PLP-dependent enzyme n=1 Tax=Robertkochia solimangrovi TaxID=2213046 RepID=UPI00117CDF40|nr:aminotransferase class V-fold PLP-dependent enzyme [Robertkochia solimangrovi]TRZ44413.1 aminotransferase [Robertkochia solimangrovi]
MITDVASDFPVLSQYTYANTAATGLLSETLMEWRQGHDLDYLIKGSLFREYNGRFLEDVREEVAKFVDAESSQTVLLPNFSFGLKTLVNGLSRNRKVLLVKDDYPSLNWPFETAGFTSVAHVDISSDPEAAVLEYFRKDTPDIFAFSMVQYLNGLCFDPAFIRELKAAYPDTLLIADGTQYLGTAVFSFENSGLDVIGTSGYKWLLAGFGNGFMCVSDVVARQCYDHAILFEPQKEEFLSGKNHLQIHLEPGHLDTLNLGSLGQSVQWLSSLGMANVEARLKEYSAFGRKEFVKLGVADPVIENREFHAPVFSLKLGKKTIDALKSRDVIFSVRGGKVRLSFHIYNSIKEMEKIAKIIKHSEGA